MCKHNGIIIGTREIGNAVFEAVSTEISETVYGFWQLFDPCGDEEPLAKAQIVYVS